jgi:bifunctional DNase/RNase
VTDPIEESADTHTVAEPGAPGATPPASEDAPGPEDAPGTEDAASPAEAVDAAAAPAPSEAASAATEFVVVEVVNVSFELPSPSPIVHLLEEVTPFRSIYFPIGLPEAQSIALAISGEQAPRPTTHDLLVSVLAAAGCEVVAVRITGERGGTILAELDLMGPRGHEVLDCRPTDGIAIALRLPVPAPILCEAGLLDR